MLHHLPLPRRSRPRRPLERCGTSRAAFRGVSCTPVHIDSARLARENPLLKGGISSAAFYKGSCTPVGQGPAPRTSPLHALRLRTCFWEAEPDARRSPRDSSRGALRAGRLEYSSRPRARTAHIDSVRLADENPLLGGQNLMRCVAQGLTCGHTLDVRLMRIDPAHLARENLLLRGWNLACDIRGCWRIDASALFCASCAY